MTISKINVVDNFLPKKELNDLLSFVNKYGMHYGWKAHKENDPHGHWNVDFGGVPSQNLANISSSLPEPIINAWNKVCTQLGIDNHALIRCYVNGYTYGTDGYFHTDSSREDETTVVIYINENWDIDWAGETVFAKNYNEIAETVMPKFNRAVVFPSNVLHCARGVSRKCTTLRRTMMFKTRKRRSDTFEKLSSYLYNAGATKFRHKDGSLHDHLVRTYQILEKRGFDTDVCLAGGLHSIFGTNAFKEKLFQMEQIREVEGEFGQKAVAGAVLFSMIARPGTIDSPVAVYDDRVVVKSNIGLDLTIGREAHNTLMAIECANLIDQEVFLDDYSNLNQFWNDKISIE